MSKTPTLIWAQRVEKVFVTWECLATKDVNVTLSEGLLTVEGTLANGDVYKLENLPLFLEIDPEGSKWFKNDRCSRPQLQAPGSQTHQARAREGLLRSCDVRTGAMHPLSRRLSRQLAARATRPGLW